MDNTPSAPDKAAIKRIRKPAYASERQVERRLAELVAARGGVCLKYYNPMAVGYPDRLIVMPGGAVAMCEVKSQGCRPRPIQQVRIEQLRDLGLRVEVVDSYASAEEFVSSL